jgi:hypothetical protein
MDVEIRSWRRTFCNLADQFAGACRVARMARFGVRSGSLERSLKEVIPLNEAG